MSSSSPSSSSSRLPFKGDPSKKIVDYSKLTEGCLPFVTQGPGRIPLVNWERINEEISKLDEKRKQEKSVGRLRSLADVPKSTALDAMRLTGKMFAKLEKMHCWYRAQSVPTKGLVPLNDQSSSSSSSMFLENGAIHSDHFGQTREYGPWDNANHFYWYIRTCVLQDATNPEGPSLSRSAMQLSSAHVVAGGEDDDEHRQEVTFAVFCDVMPPLGFVPPKRRDDPVLRAVVSYITPPLSLVEDQDAAIVPALCEFSSEFKRDVESCSTNNTNKNLITHIQLVSKSEAMSTDDAFSHLCETIAWLSRVCGCKYLIAEASNMRTATFFDELGFLPIHYIRFQDKQRLIKSDVAVPEGPSSANGFVCDKDTGMIAMVCRLCE